jgi:hypothetical protein
MNTMQAALTTSTVGPISIADLAILIEAPVEKLRPLVEHKYLRVVFAKPEFERTIVARPGQRALEWLKMMFQPINMRPFIPIREVGKLWKVTENHILGKCRSYRIPLYSDPVFGNLMSFNALKSFARARMKYYKPKRLDRASFLRFYLSQIEGVRWKHPLPYSERLEREIGRIAHLPNPQRAMRSCALFEAFRDARTVSECIRRERDISQELQRCEGSIDELVRKATTGEWRSNSRSMKRAESKGLGGMPKHGC